MTEDQFQKQVADYLRLQYPNLLWFHCPNGGSRHPAEAAKLKGMGVRPGVADILLFQSHSNLALELKAGKNKQTESQIEFERQWKEAGNIYAVCHSLEDVQRHLKYWTYDPLSKLI